MKPRIPPPNPKYIKFLAPFDLRIRDLALAARALVLAEAPDSMELIYDAYNALATGYSFTGRPSDAFIHIAVYAHWVNLGFNRGSQLEDPQGKLQGSGRWIRHIRIADLRDLDQRAVRAFVKAAAASAARADPQVGKGPLSFTAPSVSVGELAQAAGKSVVRAVYKKTRRPS